MKVSCLIVLCSLFFLSSSGQTSEIAIIPQPVSLEKKSGQFQLTGSTGIIGPDNTAEVQKITSFFSNALRKSTGYPVPVQSSKNDLSSTITFSLNKTGDAILGKKGYVLDVSANGVSITANEPTRLFYKTQTGRDEMPSFKNKIPDEEDIWHTVNYMRSLCK